MPVCGYENLIDSAPLVPLKDACFYRALIIRFHVEARYQSVSRRSFNITHVDIRFRSAL